MQQRGRESWPLSCRGLGCDSRDLGEIPDSARGRYGCGIVFVDDRERERVRGSLLRLGVSLHERGERKGVGVFHRARGMREGVAGF